MAFSPFETVLLSRFCTTEVVPAPLLIDRQIWQTVTSARLPLFVLTFSPAQLLLLLLLLLLCLFLETVEAKSMLRKANKWRQIVCAVEFVL